MVMLHMKRSDDQQFLYETTVEAKVNDVIKEMCEIHNLRLRVHRLFLEGGELAEFGPAREPSKVGIDDYKVKDSEKSAWFKEDPTGRRTGNAPMPETAKVLKKTLADADAVQNKKQVEKKVVMQKKDLMEAMDNVRGAVMINFPMGLPEWDNVRLAIEDTEELEGTSFAGDVMDPETAQLWWAGKQMMPGNYMKDHVGRNEKTKVICKLQKKGAGAPAREPVVTAEIQKEMLAFYHKKQEEQKKLEENQDDGYLYSSWANSGSLKQSLSGVSGGGVKFR